ncbi:MAG: hypothetical protein LC722_00160, partial [Actinobacteria bacterium]|nr:hypothetical protein [Actinomycetota bacterium]
MLGQLETFFGRLRDAGVPVSIHESLDAVRSAGVIDVVDREMFRSALAASIVKDDQHRPAFDAVFDVFFARRTTEPVPDDVTAESLRAALEDAARRGDLEAVRQLARQAAQALAGVGTQQSGPGYFTHRAMRAMGAEDVWRKLLEGMQGATGLEAALEEAAITAAREAFEEA